MNKKLMVVFLLTHGLIFSAFGTGQQEGEKEEVVEFLSTAGEYANAVDLAIQIFNEENTGKYSVVHTQVPLASIVEKSMVQFISGETIFDIVSLNSNWMKPTNQYLLPLDDFFKKDNIDPVERFGKGQVDVGKLNENLVCVPIRSGVFLTFYRKDLFQQEGLNPPYSLNDWLAISRKLTKRSADGNVERYGSALQLSDNWGIGQTFAFFFFGGGGRFTTADRSAHHPSLEGQYAKDVLNFMKQLWVENLIPHPLDFGIANSINFFQQGKIGIAGVYSPRATVITDPEKSKVSDQMAFGMPPFEQFESAGPGMISSTWYIGVDMNSNVKQASYKFVEFITRPEIQKKLAIEANNGPAVLEVYKDVEYQMKNPAALAVMEAMRSYDPVPGLGIGETPQAYDEMKVEIHRFMLGEQSDSETIAKIIEIIDKYLKM